MQYVFSVSIISFDHVVVVREVHRVSFDGYAREWVCMETAAAGGRRVSLKLAYPDANARVPALKRIVFFEQGTSSSNRTMKRAEDPAHLRQRKGVLESFPTIPTRSR